MSSVNKILNNCKYNILKSIEEEDWDSAVLEVIVFNDFSSYKGYYYKMNEKKNLDVAKFSFDVDNDLIDLNKITTTQNKNRWNRAKFTAFSNGTFDVEFIWDQELEDENNRLNESV